MYLSENEVRSCLAAIDAMLDVLPTGDNVPEVDREDATRDRAEYELLRIKLGKHLGE
jgi:hypothetical protein